MDLAIHIAVENKRPTIPEFVPNSLQELMKMCWSQEPQERYDFYPPKNSLKKKYFYPLKFL